MASLYKKTINGKPYWYLREMARVDGKPKMVSERYLGSAADIERLHDAREAQTLPTHTQHLGFGDTAAVWDILDRLGVAQIIDSVVGARRSDAGASVGTYLALAVLNRVVAPTSKLGFARGCPIRCGAPRGADCSNGGGRPSSPCRRSGGVKLAAA